MLLTNRTPLDQIELVLGLAEVQHKDIVRNSNYQQISQFINRKYNISSTEEDIVLLYEPSISEMEVDLRLQFEAMGLYY